MEPIQLAALLQTIGVKLSPEQLEQRVIEQIANSILGEATEEIDLSEFDEDEEDYSPKKRSWKESVKHRALAAVRTRLDTAVDKYFDEVYTGRFEEAVASILFPSTNRYGETKGEPQTLLEHFSQRAKEYMSQKVDYEGRVETSNYNDRGQPRLAWMFQKQFKLDMDLAIKNALTDIGTTLAGQISEAVKAAAAAVRVGR